MGIFSYANKSDELTRSMQVSKNRLKQNQKDEGIKSSEEEKKQCKLIYLQIYF